MNSNVNGYQQVEIENLIQNQAAQVTLHSRQIFSNESAVIKEILSTVKNNCMDDESPKQVTYPSKFPVKSTHENRLSVSKDRNDTWIQANSAEITFILTKKENYQVVYREGKG